MEIIYNPSSTILSMVESKYDPSAGYKKNTCREYNGHFLRGDYCTLEECESVPKYTFCFDVGAANLCGLNVFDFIVGLGDKLGMVLLRDNDGHSNGRLMPFSATGECNSATDWRNVIRALNKINFHGTIAIDFCDSLMAMPLPLRTDYCQFIYKMGDYLKWILNIDATVRKYPKKVLFGSGNMCRNYMANYGEEFPPLYICDNNRGLWGKKAFNTEVISPEQLNELEPDVAIFICNMYYEQVSAQLKRMGLPNPIEYYNDDYSIIP